MDEKSILEGFNKIKQKHAYLIELKKEQLQVIANILNNKTTLTVLPTGYGKTLTYVLPPIIANEVS